MSKWILDSTHSTAGFSVKHMMIAKVHGAFGQLNGELEFDPTAPERARIEATIDASSINTHEPKRDEHLRSADFFDVAQFPHLKFRSTRVELAGDGELRVTGDLTIRDVTRAVTFTVEGPTAELKDPYGQTKIGASAQAKINRREFGLTWNAALEAGDVLVGEEVTITLDVQFVKQV